MAITTHESSGLSAGVTTARTATITAHASTVVGDLLYLVCSFADNAAASVSMTGWTKVVDSNSVGTGKLQILSRVRQAGDTTYTLDIIGSNDVRWACIAINGWDTAVTPLIGTLGTRAASGGTNTLNIPSVTTTGDNWMVLACAYERTNAEDSTPTVNNGMSILLDVHTVAGDSSQSVTIASKLQTTAGSSGITTLTYTNSVANNAAGIHIGVAPLVGEAPTGRVVYFQDSFTRTVAANNWGTPDVGAAWTVSGSASYASVNGTQGVIAPGAGQATRVLTALSPAQTTIQLEADFTFDKNPIGGNMALRIIGRYIDSTNDYQTRLFVTPAGVSTIQFARADHAYVGSAYTLDPMVAGTLYKIKMLVSGVSPTTLKAKIWDSSTPEPDWQLSNFDNTSGYQVSGLVGLRPNLQGSVTNAPIAYLWDNVVISNGVDDVVAPMPTVIGTANYRNNGTTSMPITVPTGTENGDLLFSHIQISANTRDITDWSAKGWWLVANAITGTREIFTLARIYNAGDSPLVYTLTLSSSSNAVGVSVAVRNHDVTGATDLQIGNIWTRAANGGSQNMVTAPSITTTIDGSYVLAFFGHAAAATVLTPSGDFTFLDERQLNPAPEWPQVYGREMHIAGATGDQIITDNASPSTQNGLGFQVAIPYGASAIVTSGTIGHHVSLSPDSTSVTVGLKKISGSTIEAVLYDEDETELDRLAVSFDTTTQWGNAYFQGLSPNTQYNIKFDTDAVRQSDAALIISTLPVGPVSYVAVGGSCQFTGANHPVFDAIKAENAVFLAHMGDLHYVDATTEPAWRAGMETSLTAAKMRSMLQTTSMHWSMDNHDRIMVNAGGAGTALNLGTTNPLTATNWKYLAGSTGWASADTLGRTWVAGRVRYIQADMWSVRQDPDFDTGTLTFMGATQKAWWKDMLEAATEPLIIWFCNWTMMNHGNGRWNSFPAETSELESWLNARPHIKRRMVLIGGDSHSLQADSGTRTGTTYRFNGIPSLNISGFNRTGDGGDGGTYDIANAPLRAVGESESMWGGYSRLTINDNGTEVRFKWEGVRVHSSGSTDIMAYFERSYGQPFDTVKDGANQVDAVHIGATRVWQKEVKGNNL